MAKKKSKRAARKHEHHVVLDWIETTSDGMRCTRCDSFVKIGADGEYVDEIPHIRIPNEWFEIHSDPDHSPVEDNPNQQGLF